MLEMGTTKMFFVIQVIEMHNFDLKLSDVIIAVTGYRNNLLLAKWNCWEIKQMAKVERDRQRKRERGTERERETEREKEREREVENFILQGLWCR